MRLKTFVRAAAIALCATLPALAQQPAASATPAAAPPRTPYGAPITLEAAKKAMAAAEAEAAKNGWPMAIAIVDSGGHLVLSQRLDNTQLGSIRLAEGKARTSLEFRRPTKAIQDVVAAGGGGLWWLRVDDITLLEGGVPIQVDGKIVGAIGASGVLSSEDAQVAKAGADALAK
jgi:glc operon protein GlcG